MVRELYLVIFVVRVADVALLLKKRSSVGYEHYRQRVSIEDKRQQPLMTVDKTRGVANTCLIDIL
jgi:hypothetical protein